ncbi:MAG: signal recognition particle-docking protein FtsY [Candidatus Micrarchaeota archaeon]
MFDFLKKKIGGFIDGLTKKEEEKPKEEISVKEAPAQAVIEEKPAVKIEAESKKKEPATKEKASPAKKEAHPKPEEKPAAHIKAEPKKEERKPERKPPIGIKKPEIEEKKPETGIVKEEAPIEKKPVPLMAPAPSKAPEPGIPQMHIIAPKKVAEAPAPHKIAVKEEKPRERMKLGIVESVKSIITREVEINEGDVKEMLDGLELELLEADVDLGVAEAISADLRGRLIGSIVPKDKLHSFVSGSIKETLLSILANDKAFTFEERLEEVEKPLKIMFIGINGAGKTTTIAKVARLLQKSGKKVVFAAADTFRAAAIEQMDVHAQRLGVKMIKREYGSDPTSVAYDAVNYAKAHGIDAVLIDTAGRQDTNISLLNEMKKMGRVIKPDLKVYIGESIAGNAIIEQVSAFNREVGIDAVILTKLDCDPKGGTMLSLGKATGVPIIYVGMGQGYDDLERFDPQKIVERILE